MTENRPSSLNTDCSSPTSIVDEKSGAFSDCHPSLTFPRRSFAMRLVRHNSAQPYPISPREYFANLAKYTEAAAAINDTPATDGLLCVVCGDISSGKHYGVLACNGCSGFFKRTVRRKLIYHCQVDSNMCVIDKAHRNQCQACRYKKCLQMGMIREAVQNERPPRTNTQADLFPGRKISVQYSRSSEQTTITFDSSSKTKQTEYDFVNHLDDTIPSQILLMTIKWIRHLPTFLNLPTHDQRVLLEETWSELFLLSVMQYNVSVNSDDLLSSRACLDDQLIKDGFEVFENLKLDPIEFTCLKAIVLFRFDIRTLNEGKVIENLQDQAQMALAHYSQIHHPTRFGRLLLTLPILRRIPALLVEKTYFPRMSVSKLLVNMFRN